MKLDELRGGQLVKLDDGRVTIIAASIGYDEKTAKTTRIVYYLNYQDDKLGTLAVADDDAVSHMVRVCGHYGCGGMNTAFAWRRRVLGYNRTWQKTKSRSKDEVAGKLTGGKIIKLSDGHETITARVTYRDHGAYRHYLAYLVWWEDGYDYLSPLDEREVVRVLGSYGHGGEASARNWIWKKRNN